MNRYGTALAVALLAAGAGCHGKPQEPPMPPGPEDPVRNLSYYDRFAANVRRQAMEDAWNRDVRRGKERPRPAVGFRSLSTLRDEEVEGLRARLPDRTQRQALQAVQDAAVEVQLSSDPEMARILGKVYALRAERLVGGSVERRRELIETRDPAAREKIWRATGPAASELAPLLRELAAARNRWAVARSRLPFLELMRRHRGYEPAVAQRLREEVLDALPPLERPTDARPWDPEGGDPELAARMAGYLDREGLVQRAASFLEIAGLPRAPQALTLVTASGADRFWPYATYPVDPPRDVRAVITPAAGIFPHWSALHEFGHIAQALLAPERGFQTLRRPVSPAVSEACAKMAERLVYAPEWLRRQGVPEGMLAGVRDWETASERSRMRRILADAEFEESLYEDPQGNLDTIYARILRGVAGVRVPPDRPWWALDRSLTFDPLERLDYLLARCAQAAVYRRLRTLPGGLLGPDARRVLREEVLAPAAGRRYEEWFRLAAGTGPSCRAWIEDVARLPAGR